MSGKKKKHAGGRPTKMTEITIKKLEEAFAIGADVRAACAFAGISTETFYQRKKRDQKFSDRMESLREKPVLKAYNTVARNLDEVETAKWYLARKRKKEFSTRQELTGGEGAEPIAIQVVKPD